MSVLFSYTLSVLQNATSSVVFEWTHDGQPMDLAGWTAEAHIAGLWSSDMLIALTSDAGGGIQIDGEAGTITVTVDDSVSAVPNFDRYISSGGRWDLLLFDPVLEPTRLVQGPVRFSPGVTR